MECLKAGGEDEQIVDLGFEDDVAGIGGLRENIIGNRKAGVEKDMVGKVGGGLRMRRQLR